MRTIEFDPQQDIPIIDAHLVGPRGFRRVRLVFDTGCALTQIDTAFAEVLGYSAADATERTLVQGPAGDTAEGYKISVQSLKVFGKTFTGVSVGVYDFDNFARYGIDGLLGWDLIRQFELEMSGPKGLLVVR